MRNLILISSLIVLVSCQKKKEPPQQTSSTETTTTTTGTATDQTATTPTPGTTTTPTTPTPTPTPTPDQTAQGTQGTNATQGTGTPQSPDMAQGTQGTGTAQGTQGTQGTGIAQGTQGTGTAQGTQGTGTAQGMQGTGGTAAANKLTCDKILPQALRDKYLANMTVTNVAQPVEFSAVCKVEGPGMESQAQVQAACDDTVAAAADKAIPDIKKSFPDAKEVPGVGKVAIMIESGSMRQLTAWDNNSNCEVTVAVPKNVDAVAFSKDLLEALPPQG
jgi:hypothetical protein